MAKSMASILIVAAIAATGCKSSGFLAKREAEKCCPTDIRKTVPWCAGEDALFKCPCEPSAAFYGYKPTCWRTWPANGAAWRDIHCGNQHHKAVISELTQQNPELIELPALNLVPTPVNPVEAGNSESDDLESDAQPKIYLPNVKIELEPAPEPPELPKLKETPASPPAPTLKNESRPQLQENEAAEAIEEDLPTPVLGPIPLPPIDEE